MSPKNQHNVFHVANPTINSDGTKSLSEETQVGGEEDSGKSTDSRRNEEMLRETEPQSHPKEQEELNLRRA